MSEARKQAERLLSLLADADDPIGVVEQFIVLLNLRNERPVKDQVRKGIEEYDQKK